MIYSNIYIYFFLRPFGTMLVAASLGVEFTVLVCRLSPGLHPVLMAEIWTKVLPKRRYMHGATSGQKRFINHSFMSKRCLQEVKGEALSQSTVQCRWVFL